MVCARCSPYLSQVEGYGEQLQRICKNCHSSQRAARCVCVSVCGGGGGGGGGGMSE